MLQVFGSWILAQTAVSWFQGILCRVTPKEYVFHMCIYGECDAFTDCEKKIDKIKVYKNKK